MKKNQHLYTEKDSYTAKIGGVGGKAG